MLSYANIMRSLQCLCRDQRCEVKHGQNAGRLVAFVPHRGYCRAASWPTSGGLWYTDDRVDRLASKMSSKAGSKLLLVSAMTGFSASTTSLAASGSVDNSRLHGDSMSYALIAGVQPRDTRYL